MRILEKTVRIIETVTSIFSGHLQAWLIFLLMVLLLVEVLTRYVLQSPLGISHEMGAYVLVTITFMGLAYTWKEKGHVRVGFLINKLPEKPRKWLRFFTLLIAAAFSVPLIKACYDLLGDTLLFQARSGTWIRTPLVYPQTVLLIGSILLFLQLLAEIFKTVNDLRQTKEEM
jgi:TRAP-type C4-dicarboxylate transport system permease small subunit